MTNGILLMVGEEEVVDIKRWACHCGHEGYIYIFKGQHEEETMINCADCQCRIAIYG